MFATEIILWDKYVKMPYGDRFETVRPKNRKLALLVLSILTAHSLQNIAGEIWEMIELCNPFCVVSSVSW
jgi:hypothetical protein